MKGEPSPTLHCPVPPLDLGRRQQSKTQMPFQASDELALLARRHFLRVLPREGVARGLQNPEPAPSNREWLKDRQSGHCGQHSAARQGQEATSWMSQVAEKTP